MLSNSRPLMGASLAFYLAASLHGCGGKPATRTAAATNPDPVVLVTAESGPSPLHQRLRAQAPALALPTSGVEHKLDSALADYHQRVRSHRAYIATDKPLYRPGETVWFRTFDLFSAGFTGEPGEYATNFQLISPKGAVVMEKRARTQAGAAANDFVIPGHVPGGEYTIKAITDQGTEVERSVIVSSYQPPRIKKKLEFLRKAYGAGDKVAAAIAVHRATGEALANKAITGLVVLDGAELVRVPVTTDATGKAVVRFPLPAQISRGDGLLTVLIEDGGITESIQKRIPITVDKLQFAMFPEGGDLVAGLPGRVYFSAKNLMDKPADVDGRVVDDLGQTVARFRSHYNGMGRFEIVARAGRSYRAEITRPVGITSTFDLPKVAAAGCSMQALDDFDSKDKDLRVAVWCSTPAKVVATAVLRDRRLATRSVAVAAGAPSVITLPAPASAQGAVRVTLFDADLDPIAERLVYRNRRADLEVEISADRDSYNPRDKVVLNIATRGVDGKPVAADLALAVVDDTVLSFADDKTAHLMARLYLESEMPGQKIEEPNFYFSEDDKAAAGLDCVLGTQGWRRFDWKLVFVPPPPITASWNFSGEYWRDQLGYYRLDELDDDGENEGNVGKKDGKIRRRVAKRPPRVALANAAEAPAADEKAPDMEPNMPAPPMREAVAIMGRGDMMMDEEMGWRGGEDHNFEVGLERKKKGKRIRDKDWAGAEVNDRRRWNWAPTRQFPVPNYSARYDGPRVDFRETVFWQPQVVTGADGKAEVSFYLSDAVTSFRVTAEGVGAGVPGRGDTLVTAKLPVSLAVKMPLEVASGDLIRLPVTVTNETDEAYTAKLQASFGPAFQLAGDELPESVELAARQRKSFFYELRVVGTGAEAADGKALVSIEAANLRDEVERTIKVAPLGFPQEISVAGTAGAGERNRHLLIVADPLPGTMKAELTMYPSPLATMVEGTQAIIREPTGCFEQASSANYPNIMILDYLDEHEAADPELIERTHGMLDRGYKKLTGYESKNKGFEWFGGDPGHEALTAYGLMEFVDMTRVYADVDRDMIKRTAAWLKKRRDGKGGYSRNARALDSFGAASPEVTDAYITYALTEAKTKKIGKEIARQASVAAATKDPYIMALATNTLLNGKDKAAANAVRRLGEMQGEDGGFAGADHSITRSGGDALLIETTSLAALAMMKAGDDYSAKARKAIEWLNDHRNGFGGYGSTQSTVLALKAMSTYAATSRRTRASGMATIYVNGEQAGRLTYEKGHQGTLVFDLGNHLRVGKNSVEVELESTEALPYSMAVTYSSKVPATSPEAVVELTTALAKDRVPMGEGVRMRATVKNITDEGIPMTLARIGIPGGLTFQTWQLKELRDKKLIDFYETREREVILYFRSLAPNAEIDIDIELKAEVPGTYTAPASRAYLYYTDEHKHWVAPEKVTVVR